MLNYLVCVFSGVLISFSGILLGAWLVFKSKARPGETFLKEPKGEVFTIKDGLDEIADFPEESEDEKRVLKRTEEFLKKLGGE